MLAGTSRKTPGAGSDPQEEKGRRIKKRRLRRLGPRGARGAVRRGAHAHGNRRTWRGQAAGSISDLAEVLDTGNWADSAFRPALGDGRAGRAVGRVPDSRDSRGAARAACVLGLRCCRKGPALGTGEAGVQVEVIEGR